MPGNFLTLQGKWVQSISDTLQECDVCGGDILPGAMEYAYTIGSPKKAIGHIMTVCAQCHAEIIKEVKDPL